MSSEGSMGFGGARPVKELGAHPIETSTLLISQSSPLQYVGDDETHRARFAGTLVMDGTWHFRWLDEVNYEFIFVPDDGSALPHWSAEPVAIIFENDQPVLDAVMTHKARAGLRLRRQLLVSGRVRITADHLTTAIDRDGNPHCWMRCRDIERTQATPSADPSHIAERFTVVRSS